MRGWNLITLRQEIKRMRKGMEDYRTLIAGFLAGVLGWLEPIAGDVFTLFYIFVMNFVFGYLSGRIVYGEDFNFKKAFECISQSAIFFLTVFSIYMIGDLKNQEEGAIQLVSTVVYVVIYFYTTNILKNIRKFLKTGTPGYKVVDFLYYLLSFEIIHKIPVLSDYLEKQPENKECNGAEA